MNVFYVSKIQKNLFSVGTCTIKGYEVRFKEDQVNILRDNVLVATDVKQENKIYRMFFKTLQLDNQNEINMSLIRLRVWHERLGHVGKRPLRKLVEKEFVEGITIKDTSQFFCKSCELGKAHKLPFKETSDRTSTKAGELTHSDVCGHMSEESLGGARFFVIFKDDATNYRHAYFIRHTLDVFEKFKDYE